MWASSLQWWTTRRRLIYGRQNYTPQAWLLSFDAEGVADRSWGSERSFDPRIEERANTKHPEGMPDRVIPSDLQPQGHVTQELTQRGFEGNQSNTTCTDSILAVKSRFLASLRDAFTNSIPFRGFPLRFNPRLRSAIASRSRLTHA